MRVLGFFICCSAAVLLQSLILEKRNAEVEIPHVQDEVRPLPSAGRMHACIFPSRDSRRGKLLGTRVVPNVVVTA
jgi:hypothetical protein